MGDYCRACHRSDPELVLDLGEQAICNRFLYYATEEEPHFPLRLGQCRGCATLQLLNPVPYEETRARFPWITYNEPEGHLDDLVETLVALEGVTTDSVIGGVTYKEDTTLERLRHKGYTRTWRIDPVQDLGVSALNASLETIQAYLTVEAAADIATRKPLADVLIVRHILEHAFDMNAFLKALPSLIEPGGYIVFEVPDNSRIIASSGFSYLWEEHIGYFTEATFKRCLEHASFEVVKQLRYRYAVEDSLNAIVRWTPDAPQIPSPPAEVEFTAVRAFVNSFEETRRRYHEYFSDFVANNGPLAMFGAGHLAVMFINLFDLGSFFIGVLDDHPDKAGLFLPGSRLPVLSSRTLYEREVGLCLMSLSPESEVKVMRNNQRYSDAGGRFASIFPTSANALVL